MKDKPQLSANFRPLRYCPNCGQRLAQNAETCFMCGTELAAPQRRRLRFQIGDLLLIAVVVSVAFLWWTRGASRDSVPAGQPTPVVLAPITATPTETPTAGPSPTPTETPTITPTPTPIYYTVVRGDTVEKIALEYAVSVEDLMIVNGLTSDLIRIDQKLLIPAGPLERGPDGKPLPTATPTPRSAIYLVQVRPGDTIENIAKRLGTSAEAIIGANDWVENSDTIIRPGDQLIVPVGTVTARLTPQSDQRPTNTPVPTLTPTPGMRWPAPQLLGPRDDAIFQGGSVLLQWLSVGTLSSDEVYVVRVMPEDDESQELVSVTVSTSYRVAEDWLDEKTGEDSRFLWTVQVARDVRSMAGQASGLREASTSSPRRSFIWEPAASRG